MSDPSVPEEDPGAEEEVPSEETGEDEEDDDTPEGPVREPTYT